MMNIKLQIKHIVAGFALVFCFAVAGFAQDIPMVGGYSSISKDSSEAVEAAQFAVAEKSGTDGVSIELEEILSAERQSVHGTNYRLCIEAAVDGDRNRQFLIVVFKSWKENEFSLRSWKERKCAE